MHVFHLKPTKVVWYRTLRLRVMVLAEGGMENIQVDGLARYTDSGKTKGNGRHESREEMEREEVSCKCCTPSQPVRLSQGE